MLLHTLKVVAWTVCLDLSLCFLLMQPCANRTRNEQRSQRVIWVELRGTVSADLKQATAAAACIVTCPSVSDVWQYCAAPATP